MQLYGERGTLDLVPIIALLEETGIEYSVLSPETAVNALKDTPALVDSITTKKADGTPETKEVKVIGRNAILRYVGEQFKLEYFYPKQSSERADADLALDFYSNSFYPIVKKFLDADSSKTFETVKNETEKDLSKKLDDDLIPAIKNLIDRGAEGTIGISG